MQPGIYIAREDEDDYGTLVAMTLTGEAKLVGERYDVDGKKEIAASVGVSETRRGEMTPNVEVTLGIGAEYFALALKDYSSWRETWFREAIQNAVDAGARNVDIVIEQQSDGQWLVSCQDDGRGMDEDVLVNKFMQLGGTTKKVGGTTGGFGKAKELLILPWIAYEIHTQDRVLKGAGSKSDMTTAPYLQGTRISVLMPADNATTPAAAIAFIGKCYIPGVKFTVNGETVKAKLKRGEVIRDIEGIAEICHDAKQKDRFESEMIVRVKTGDVSLAMFTKYVNSEIPGQLTVEIIGRSTEILTANRDGFRDWRLNHAVDSFVGELAADVMSAVKRKKGIIREKFEGETFRAQAPMREAALVQTLGRLEPEGDPKKKGSALLSDEQIAMIGAVLTELESSAPRAPKTEFALAFRSTAEMGDVVLHGMSVRGATHMEAIAKQLAWQPAFYLMNDIEGWKPPKKFYPESMTRQVRLLASYWAEMCRFVLMQLGSAEPYGVGFSFDADAGAKYAPEGKEHWLMLNPIAAVDPRRDDEVIDLNGDIQTKHGTVDAASWLYALAVHECTHMADGISYHNESFASALTTNMALTANKDKQIRGIKKLVLAREKETAERLRAEKPPREPRPKKVGLGPLVDKAVEEYRADRARTQPGYFTTYCNDEDRVWDLQRELKSAIREIEHETYHQWEIRDDAGKPVWRSQNFSLPTEQAQRQAKLPPLSSEYRESNRAAEARASREDFSTFRNLANDAIGWINKSNIERIKSEIEDEQRAHRDDYFEIRNKRGEPVWRSDNFPQDL